MEKIAREAAQEVNSTIEDHQHPIQVWFEGFGDSSLNFSLIVWIRMHRVKAKTGLMSDYYYALYKKLTKAGIEIPFPQQDIHIRSLYPQVAEGFKNRKKALLISAMAKYTSLIRFWTRSSLEVYRLSCSQEIL